MKLLILWFLVASLPNISEASEAIFIGELESNEFIEVEFASSGCFRTFTDLYVFRKNNVTIYQIKEGKLEFDKKKLGTLHLSESDVRGLDLLFRYYAKEKDPRVARSTTTERIKIGLFRDGHMINENEFTHSHFRYDGFDGLVFFGQLKKRIETTKE